MDDSDRLGIGLRELGRDIGVRDLEGTHDLI
jgi:hypothetical protein